MSDPQPIVYEVADWIDKFCTGGAENDVPCAEMIVKHVIEPVVAERDELIAQSRRRLAQISDLQAGNEQLAAERDRLAKVGAELARSVQQSIDADHPRGWLADALRHYREALNGGEDG